MRRSTGSLPSINTTELSNTASESIGQANTFSVSYQFQYNCVCLIDECRELARTAHSKILMQIYPLIQRHQVRLLQRN